jgi:hypothetical protein
MKPGAQLSTNTTTAQLVIVESGRVREWESGRAGERENFRNWHFLPLSPLLLVSRSPAPPSPPSPTLSGSLSHYYTFIRHHLRKTTIDCCDFGLTSLYLVEYILPRSRPKGPCNCIGSELPSLPFASIWVFNRQSVTLRRNTGCVSRARWEFPERLLAELKSGLIFT